jgi:hypothetical protein
MLTIAGFRLWQTLHWKARASGEGAREPAMRSAATEDICFILLSPGEFLPIIALSIAGLLDQDQESDQREEGGAYGHDSPLLIYLFSKTA